MNWQTTFSAIQGANLLPERQCGLRVSQALYQRNDPIFDLCQGLIGWRAVEIMHLPEFDSREILRKPLLQKGQMLILFQCDDMISAG